MPAQVSMTSILFSFGFATRENRTFRTPLPPSELRLCEAKWLDIDQECGQKRSLTNNSQPLT
jgi:hypothetical protein